MIPVIKMIAYESRDPDRIFVAVPDERGRYVLTDRSVAYVACPLCKSLQYEPCKGHSTSGKGNRYAAGTHHQRRSAAASLVRLDRTREGADVKPKDVIR